MKPLLHEFRHHLRTATVVAAILILGIAGFAVAYEVVQPSLGGFQFVSYYDQGYHFLFYATTDEGTDLGGAHVAVWINNTTFTPYYYSNAPLAQVQGQTGTNGEASLWVDLPASNYSFSTEVIGGGSTLSDAGELGNQSSGGGTSQSSFLASGWLYVMPVGFWDPTTTFSILPTSPAGTFPSGSELRYTVVRDVYTYPPYPIYNYSGPPIALVHPAYTVGNTLPYAALSGPHVKIPWTATVSDPSNYSVDLMVFAPNGTELANTSVSAESLLPAGISPAGTSAENLLISLQPVIALFGILLAYVRYGKDRSLRSIESVLWRPVTRTGLFPVRFGVIALALASGIALLIGVLASWVALAYPAGFPPGALLVIFGVLLAEGVAFAGLVMLSSHFLRSRGGVIAFAAGIFLFFAFFFNVVIALLALTTQTSFGDASSSLLFFNPAQLLAPAFQAITPQAPATGYFGGGVISGPLLISSGPSSPPVSVPSLVLAVVLWSAGPFLLTFYLAKNTD
jgi:ABC-type transport system involved in multi-copper enzyme maturation permease subunit